MKKKLVISLIFLLLLSTYQLQNNFELKSKFKIKKITIENNLIIEDQKIEKKLSFLYQTNLFFLKKKKIEAKLNDLNFIHSFEIKKIYPNKIIIKVFEKEPIAIIQNKKEKMYYTKEGEVINFLDLKKFYDLPVVFGDKESFKIIHKNLIESNFPTEIIKRYYSVSI